MSPAPQTRRPLPVVGRHRSRSCSRVSYGTGASLARHQFRTRRPRVAASAAQLCRTAAEFPEFLPRLTNCRPVPTQIAGDDRRMESQAEGKTEMKRVAVFVSAKGDGIRIDWTVHVRPPAAGRPVRSRPLRFVRRVRLANRDAAPVSRPDPVAPLPQTAAAMPAPFDWHLVATRPSRLWISGMTAATLPRHGRDLPTVCDSANIPERAPGVPSLEDRIRVVFDRCHPRSGGVAQPGDACPREDESCQTGAFRRRHFRVFPGPARNRRIRDVGAANHVGQAVDPRQGWPRGRAVEPVLREQ